MRTKACNRWYPFRKFIMVRILLALSILCTPAESRNWTDVTGKFSAEGHLAGVKVVLKKANGKTVEVPLDLLSEADQQYVKNSISEAKTIIGKVAGVTDGDTITVSDGDTQHTIRLNAIDTPEMGQDFGTEARKALVGKVFQKRVRVEWQERDRYDRIIGNVYLDDRWINKEMIADGCAWHYKQYSDSKELAEAEIEAKDEEEGLWADADPMPPWVFRNGPSETDKVVTPSTSRPTAPGVTSKPRGPPKEKQDVIVYVTRTGSKHHRANCRYLRKSKIPIPLSRAKQSYEPCSVCKPLTVALKSEEPSKERDTTFSSGDESIRFPFSREPAVAENNDVRGADNDGDGRREPVHVRGYYRKDGTYVRGHYRARPGR